jgi:hypothetical protein
MTHAVLAAHSAALKSSKERALKAASVEESARSDALWKVTVPDMDDQGDAALVPAIGIGDGGDASRGVARRL